MNDRSSAPRTDRRAVASLLCAAYLILLLLILFLQVTDRVHFHFNQIIGGIPVGGWLLLLWPVATLAGIVLGHLSRSAIRKSDGYLKGRGMAAAGLTVNYISALSLALLWPLIFRTGGGGNESAAVANLRTINMAEATYLLSDDRYGTIPDLVARGLLDDRFIAAVSAPPSDLSDPRSVPSDTPYNGTVSGYRFDVQVSGRDYIATSIPASSNTGRFGYYSRADGVIHYSMAASLAPAGQAGQPVQ